MSTPNAGSRDQRRLDRRAAIIGAARESFLKDGYSAMSMSALVRTLSGSKTTLWSHFPTKEALFAAVLGDIGGSFLGELDTLLATEDELRDVLVAYCESFLRLLCRPDFMTATRLVIAEGGRLPHLTRIFHEQAIMPNLDSLTGFLRRQVARGSLRPGDPQEMAWLLADLCVGVQSRLLLGVETSDAEPDQASCRRFTDAFLRIYAVEA